MGAIASRYRVHNSALSSLDSQNVQSESKRENPGTLDELHKKTKEVMPVNFEGGKLMVNKGMSNHFQINPKKMKKMWQNFKAKTREAKTLETQKRKTGGGPPPPDMPPTATQVLSIIPSIMPTIKVPIDSDVITAQNEEHGDDDSPYWLPKKRRTDSTSEILIPNPHLQHLSNPLLPNLQYPKRPRMNQTRKKFTISIKRWIL